MWGETREEVGEELGRGEGGGTLVCKNKQKEINNTKIDKHITP